MNDMLITLSTSLTQSKAAPEDGDKMFIFLAHTLRRQQNMFTTKFKDKEETVNHHCRENLLRSCNFDTIIPCRKNFIH